MTFAHFEVRVADAETAGRAVAEAWAAGAAGIEEREEGAATCLLVYADEACVEQVGSALRGVLGAASVGEPLPVPPADWSEAWKTGITATVISDRLVVRPSFVPSPPGPGRIEILVEPGQAFGTGGHASTRLALEWLVALAGAGVVEGARVLDVGTGSGVLALAAVSLGARVGVGFDLDRTAVREALRAGHANGLAERVRWLAGPIEAVSGGYDVLVANLLRREMLPLAEAMAARVRPGGRAVLSGLLASERDPVTRALEAVGFAAEGAREHVDEGGDRWLGLLMVREG